MFISIPKEFFVPVLFSDKFTLNLDNNNMEYDTERHDIKTNGYRVAAEEPIKNPVKGSGKMPIEENVKGSPEYLTEEAEEKAKVKKEIDLDKANDNIMLDEADEEFIHSKSVEL